jgi:hypothetical protein
MHLFKSYLRRTVDLYAGLQPPEGTTLLQLPANIVPAPLGVEDGAVWMRPERETKSHTAEHNSFDSREGKQ